MKYQELTINTDGGARGNPGPAAIGISARSGKDVLFEISEYIGEQTNNVAEYTAVIHALNHLKQHRLTARQCSFILDSELIVRQIIGQYRVKEPRLRLLVGQVHRLVAELRSGHFIDQINFRHTLRTENARADYLVNQALDARD